MRRMWFAGWMVGLVGCSASHQASTAPSLPVDAKAADTFFTPTGPGPTTMSKVAGGYQLENRLFRVVISDQTGDVIYWGHAGEGRNMVYQHGIYTRLTALPITAMQGYIEKRDEQTWQFYGQDQNHITWRKIYCLEGMSLLVSVIVQNDSSEPLQTAIQICGDLPSLRILYHDPEQFTGSGGYGSVSLHGYNEFHVASSQPVLPILIQSDVLQLKAGQRRSYTSQWTLSQ